MRSWDVVEEGETWDSDPPAEIDDVTRYMLVKRENELLNRWGIPATHGELSAHLAWLHAVYYQQPETSVARDVIQAKIDRVVVRLAELEL